MKLFIFSGFMSVSYPLFDCNYFLLEVNRITCDFNCVFTMANKLDALFNTPQNIRLYCMISVSIELMGTGLCYSFLNQKTMYIEMLYST